MSGIISLLGAGNPLRAWFTGGVAVALLLAGLAIWIQTGMVSDRDQKIGGLRSDVKRIEGQRDAAVQVADGNAAALAEEQRLRRVSDTAVDLLMQRQQRAAPVMPKITKEANRVAQANPHPSGCPAADPVWDAVAAGLRDYRQILVAPAGKDGARPR